MKWRQQTTYRDKVWKIFNKIVDEAEISPYFTFSQLI